MFSTNSDKDTLYDSLFYEPFYQLMRLQLLAQEMESYEDKEMDADIVSVLHVCPVANREFRERIISPYLERNYSSEEVLEIWKKLIPGDKFMSISVEDLLNTIQDASMAEREWVDYLKRRYGWRYQI